MDRFRQIGTRSWAGLSPHEKASSSACASQGSTHPGTRGLTRRCSGLATLAAELHFVRPTTETPRDDDRQTHGVSFMIPGRKITERFMLAFSHRPGKARPAPWLGPAGGALRRVPLLSLPVPERPCRIASWAPSHRRVSPLRFLPPFLQVLWPMPRRVTPTLDSDLVLEQAATRHVRASAP